MHSSRMRTVRCSDRREGVWGGGGGGGLVAQAGMYPSMHCTGGVYIPACTGQGVCIPACTEQGGVWPGGCLPGGVVCWGGGLFAGGVVCWGCLPHPPVDRMTDTCENITFPQLRCRR